MNCSTNGCASLTYQRQHPLLNPHRRVRPDNDYEEFKIEQAQRSVPHRFRTLAELYPGHLAVKSRTGKFTYEELDRASNVVARLVIRVIGNTSEPVALLMEKDHILVASILGALKSRKFYVALDASYPVARNRQILEDSESSLLLTSASYCGVARELAGANVRVLPLNPIDLSEGAGDPELDIPADDLACVLYTSGSTGAPKGVMQTHRNLMTQVMNVTNSQHISPGDRFSLLHSPSFAAATHNLFGSLLNGASVFPFEVQKEGLVMLKEWLLAERITVYHSAPSLFRSFGRSLAGGIPFTDLRLIVLGGEMVLNRDVDLYKTLFPDSCLLRINLGISEANVFTEFFVDIATELRPGPIPVGYAVPGVEVAVIDESGGRAEAYGVGEITVKSAHLSPGYWRQPDLTATAFSGDPYGSGERVYRTGDIGYLTEDGCLVCLGRQDSLVKIRGFRVETAEVEFALLTLKGLKEAAVNTGKDRQGKTRLVAHVALEDGFALSGADLRASLRQMLPDFMVPSGFVLHAELPRNARGKIDRQQLIEETNLELATAASGRGNKVYAGPGLAARNESVHSRLIEIWERILGLQGIGAEQDFFELGGDSLAAASMAAEIEGVFGIRFLPSMLLELPTIRQIGLRIVEADSGTGSLVPITVTGSNAPFFCAHDICGDVIAYRALAGSLGPDQPFYGLRARRDSNGPVGIPDLARCYIEEIQSVYPAGPYNLGGYSFGGLLALEMAQQLVARGFEVGLLALIDTYGPGYPKLLPFVKRLAIHFRNLLRGPTDGRLEYIRNRIRVNVARLRRLRMRTPRLYTGGPVPAGSLGVLSAVHYLAARNYSLKPYPGRLDLFRADQSELWRPDPLIGWGGFAEGGIEVHQVSGSHLSMLAEPNAGQLAEQLRCLLDLKSS